MYIGKKLFVLFSGFIWLFGFLTGVLYSETYRSCHIDKTTSFTSPIEKRDAVEPKVPAKEHIIETSRASEEVLTQKTDPPPARTDALCKDPTTPNQASNINSNCVVVFQNNSLSMDKFSIIIPTFKRVKLLKKVLDNYCALHTHVDTIVVVWNNIHEAIPQELHDFSCQVNLFIKKQTVNSLNNRFVLYPEIKTQAVLSADDDLLILHEDLIYQFETWKQFKHLIIGFAPRKHLEQPAGSGKFVYGGPPKDGESDRRYSFILTTSAMFHVQYLDLYQSQLPKNFRDFVDRNMNCEDIFLNALVAEHLRVMMGSKQSPALLVPYKDIKMIEGENRGYKGLWSRPKHKKVRHECLNLISNYFHGFPFDYSSLKITTA